MFLERIGEQARHVGLGAEDDPCRSAQRHEPNCPLGVGPEQAAAGVLTNPSGRLPMSASAGVATLAVPAPVGVISLVGGDDGEADMDLRDLPQVVPT